MTATQGSEHRIAMRVAPEQKALIERAAEAQGLSVTDFMLGLALREAKATLAERTVFILGEAAYDRFLAILDRPAQEQPAFRRLIDNNRRGNWNLQA